MLVLVTQCTTMLARLTAVASPVGALRHVQRSDFVLDRFNHR
mgnify:CR=1 FL=1